MEVEPHTLSAFDLNPNNISAYFSGMPGSSEEAPASIDQMDEISREWDASASPRTPAAALTRCSSNAAMKVQKVYRSYRTRRMLADSAVVAEELW